MRIHAFLFAAAAAATTAASAQDAKEATRTTYTFDSNGRRQAVYDQASASSASGLSQL